MILLNKNGSILIWTFFVSLFIVSFFIAFQSNFLNLTNNTRNYGEKIQNNIQISDEISNLKNSPKGEILIGESDKIISLDYNSGSLDTNLNFNIETEYPISSSGGETQITLNLTGSGILFYNLVGLNSSNSGIIIGSGKLDISSKTKNIALDFSSYSDNILFIKNLGENTTYNINYGQAKLLAPKNFYKLVRIYPNLDETIKFFEVRNFDTKSNPKINYSSLGLYLNTNKYE